MNLRFAVPLLVLAALCTASCRAKRVYKVTPVTPVATTAEEEQALRQQLQDKAWRVERTITDGEEEDYIGGKYWTMSFEKDGSFTFRYMGRGQPFTWVLAGKNITTTHPGVPAVRVDSLTPKELRLFYYETSSVWILTHD